MVPKAIQTHFRDYMEIDKHPVIVLSSSILRFAEQCLDPEMRASFFSPRLMEAVIWFIARWSCTYLMPPEETTGSSDHLHYLQSNYSSKAWLTFFGVGNQGKLVLDIIVRISKITLVSYPGETDLQALTCYQLLYGLVQRKNISTHLVALDSWHDLTNAFANERTLFSLNAVHQRSLAQTLTLSASAMSNSEASNQYVRSLVGYMTAYLVEISSKNNLKNIAQQPDVMLLVSCLLERLRGTASASEPRTQKAIYEMGFSVMNSVLIFLEVYKHELSIFY
ncbi:hypothetical protein U1Q18_014817 [Sarracenia purpurea var. burkii]